MRLYSRKILIGLSFILIIILINSVSAEDNSTDAVNTVCRKLYYMILNTNDNYTSNNLLEVQQNINVNISISTLKYYADDFNNMCNVTGLKVSYKKNNFPYLYMYDINKSDCNLTYNTLIAGYDLDLFIPFFNINLANIKCSNVDKLKIFFSLSEDAEGIYINGIKLYLILICIVLFLIYEIIISRNFLKSIKKSNRNI